MLRFCHNWHSVHTCRGPGLLVAHFIAILVMPACMLRMFAPSVHHVRVQQCTIYICYFFGSVPVLNLERRGGGGGGGGKD